jgi:hypothetical protein
VVKWEYDVANLMLEHLAQKIVDNPDCLTLEQLALVDPSVKDVLVLVSRDADDHTPFKFTIMMQQPREEETKSISLTADINWDIDIYDPNHDQFARGSRRYLKSPTRARNVDVALMSMFPYIGTVRYILWRWSFEASTHTKALSMIRTFHTTNHVTVHQKSIDRCRRYNGEGHLIEEYESCDATVGMVSELELEQMDIMRAANRVVAESGKFDVDKIMLSSSFQGLMQCVSLTLGGGRMVRGAIDFETVFMNPSRLSVGDYFYWLLDAAKIMCKKYGKYVQHLAGIGFIDPFFAASAFGVLKNMERVVKDDVVHERLKQLVDVYIHARIVVEMADRRSSTPPNDFANLVLPKQKKLRDEFSLTIILGDEILPSVKSRLRSGHGDHYCGHALASPEICEPSSAYSLVLRSYNIEWQFRSEFGSSLTQMISFDGGNEIGEGVFLANSFEASNARDDIVHFN